MPEAIDLLAAYDPLGDDGGPVSAARRYILLDVFTDTPLAGNQLAVFTDARGLSVATMQGLARELNLSETVFVLPASAAADIRIRIFTPVAELPFAGHPVLGAAIVAGAALGRERLTLQTEQACVPVRLEPGGGRTRSGWMEQPIPSWSSYEHQRELFAALGVARSGLPVAVYENGPRHVYVELTGERDVATLAPDLRALAALGEVGVNCFAGSGGYWKTRMFLPALGVPEDPATGSAAGPLAVHLARHGRVAWGEQIAISQGAEVARPSRLLACATGSALAVERVEVGGAAVMLARGEFAGP